MSRQAAAPRSAPVVRAERPGDRKAVREILLAAFAGPVEAEIVDELRRRDAVSLALVAEVRDEVVGHLLFSPVTIEGLLGDRLAVGLAPLAVLPGHQRRGVGAALVREGLVRGRDLGWEAVVVLGDPAYYQRFGFAPAHERGLRCEFPCPPEAFMVLELVSGALARARGLVRYEPVFGGAA